MIALLYLRLVAEIEARGLTGIQTFAHNLVQPGVCNFLSPLNYSRIDLML